MNEKTAARTREKWVDDVKVIACILVVLGLFFSEHDESEFFDRKWFAQLI